MLGDRERGSDRDQQLSDCDQALSDRDQALSDRDQTASDADQAAADADQADGRSEAAYEHSAAVRSEGTRERLEIGVLRDEGASERDAMARARDDVAAQRDREAVGRDDESRELDLDDARFEKRLASVEDVRSRMALARSRAADDRARAQRDREQAARDREQAARDREQAARERRQAGTDELTGARRRGVGLEELQREIDRVRRTDGRLVVAYVDVDSLKSVNDELGHTAGDELLREVADGLRRHTRSYDLVVRLGGDEFLCALSDISVEQVRRRFEELNAELHDAPVAGSISFGVGELRNGDSTTDLIDQADRDLLAARATRLTTSTPGATT